MAVTVFGLVTGQHPVGSARGQVTKGGATCRTTGGGAPRRAATALLAGAAIVMSSCGGGSGSLGNTLDSGIEKTQLSVAAHDDDGDTLQYEWRVTAGSVDNRNAAQTTWTLPEGPGLHFAYVLVTDGRGGTVMQQYAVATDAIDRPAPMRTQGLHAPETLTQSSAVSRLRVRGAGPYAFVPEGGGAPVERWVNLPGVQVQVVDDNGAVQAAGTTDRGGEFSVSGLTDGRRYTLRCARSAEALAFDCGSLTGGTLGQLVPVVLPAGVQGTSRASSVAVPSGANLRLHGHVSLGDGGICGVEDRFFQVDRGAEVRLLAADGRALAAPQPVNRHGDYALEASVPTGVPMTLEFRCESLRETRSLAALPAPAVATVGQLPVSVEQSHRFANRRPAIDRMVAVGSNGSVRGKPVVDLAGAASRDQPGMLRFLTYKALDTAASACAYYKSLGLVSGCGAQGELQQAVTMDAWQQSFGLPPYASAAGGGGTAAANYINRMDLNLVRRMTAAKTGNDRIAFLVCNHPGPDGASQAEVDDVMGRALAGDRMVACVGMAWASLPGVNGGRPFTQFLTFGPDGSLLPSVNLDGRGEKYLPGACIACHGGTRINGRFPETGRPSPDLGAGFLPFDTGNYAFGTGRGLSEAEQTDAIFRLNELVRATEAYDRSTGAAVDVSRGVGATPITRLLDGWYAGGTTLDKAYVPPAWKAAEAVTPGASRFYREVVGSSCRTCHVALDTPSMLRYDWDRQVLSPSRAQAHVCGGTADLVTNQSMPNALVTLDRLTERIGADAQLQALKRQILGCDAPSPDPAFARR